MDIYSCKLQNAGPGVRWKAETTKKSPNDVRRVVWAIVSFFFLFFMIYYY
jgi:hypothetical protein